MGHVTWSLRVSQGLETSLMIAGHSRIHLIGVIGMNVSHTRRFVTAKIEPEATVVTP